jgi:hypothetical protein
MKEEPMRSDRRDWLENPHPVNTMRWWHREQAIYEIINDIGAFFDDAGNRIEKGPNSDLHDEFIRMRQAGVTTEG